MQTPVPKTVLEERNLSILQEGLLAGGTISDQYLYRQIAIGREAEEFFARTLLGATLDRRAREEYADAVSEVMSADPTDASAIMKAQIKCQAIVLLFRMVDDAIAEGKGAKQEKDQRYSETE